jgi:sulfotransferase family protein
MGGIVWLASYPKSGNTWVRSFLQNLIVNPSTSVHINELSQFAYGDGQKYWYERAAGGSLEGMSPEAVMALTPKAHDLMTKSRPQSVFVKTHNSLSQNWGVPYITAEATVGAIHIVRNPLDVVISLAHHFGFSIDEAIAFMNNPEAQTPEDEHKLSQFYGTWSDHTMSWQKFNPQYIHRVRYEDLLLKPGPSFSAIAKFLGIKPPKNILNKAIKNASFKTLQAQEKKDGFLEKSDKAEMFFRSGKAGAWKTALSADQVKQLVEVHHDKMQEFGYLKGVSV